MSLPAGSRSRLRGGHERTRPFPWPIDRRTGETRNQSPLRPVLHAVSAWDCGTRFLPVPRFPAPWTRIEPTTKKAIRGVANVLRRRPSGNPFTVEVSSINGRSCGTHRSRLERNEGVSNRVFWCAETQQSGRFPLDEAIAGRTQLGDRMEDFDARCKWSARRSREPLLLLTRIRSEMASGFSRSCVEASICRRRGAPGGRSSNAARWLDEGGCLQRTAAARPPNKLPRRAKGQGRQGGHGRPAAPDPLDSSIPLG